MFFLWFAFTEFFLSYARTPRMNPLIVWITTYPVNVVFSLLLHFLMYYYLLLLLRCFRVFAQAVVNAEIFLLVELKLVAKRQEDAFPLHVYDFPEYHSCSQQDWFFYYSNIQFNTKCVHPSTEALANAPQSSYNHWYNLNLFKQPKSFQLSLQILIFFNLFNFFITYPGQSPGMITLMMTHDFTFFVHQN